ncbi:GDSL-like Lipase/Acylhydrolase family protein [compost metagenome]
MPNLANKDLYPEGELRKRITEAVDFLQKKHPLTPILLVEHSGRADSQLLETRLIDEFTYASTTLSKVFYELKAKGIKRIYLLKSAEIGMGIESTVDGVHPNDIGMMEHANAFAKKISAILKE